MECCDDVGKSNRGSQRVIHSCLKHFISLMFFQDNFYQCPSKYLKRIIIIWSSYSQRRLHLGLHLKKQMGRKSKEDYVQLTHFAIEQKLTQHCKATKHQFKKKKKKQMGGCQLENVWFRKKSAPGKRNSKHQLMSPAQERRTWALGKKTCRQISASH